MEGGLSIWEEIVGSDGRKIIEQTDFILYNIDGNGRGGGFKAKSVHQLVDMSQTKSGMSYIFYKTSPLETAALEYQGTLIQTHHKVKFIDRLAMRVSHGELQYDNSEIPRSHLFVNKINKIK